MLAAALLLIAQPTAAALADPVPAPLPCPVPRTGFAPPLDVPMQLTRTIQRQLARGDFIQTISYSLLFTRDGRGFRLRWQQTGQQADGPADLLRLLALQEDAAQGERLDFTLDSRGALLGVSESPDTSQRLAGAIARLRADPAFAGLPARERSSIGEMLDRLAAMPPDERARLHMGKASRLLAFAGQACRSGHLTASDGSLARITGADDEWLVLAGFDDDPAGGDARVSSAWEARVSRHTGLAASWRRTTVSTITGSTRTSRESHVLDPLPPARN